MSRSFDGVDDVISATVTAIANGDSWTVAAWIWPGNAGEGDQGVIFRCDTGGGVARQTVRFDDSSLHLRVVQVHGTANAQTVTSSAPATSAWSCIVATYRASDDTCRVYLGDLDSPMAEASYASQTAGTGAQTVGGPTALIGNNSAGNGTFSGNIGLVAFAGREWSAAEIEEFRLGRRPATSGTLRGFWPLDSPTASQAEDLSGNGANGTVTGATVAEDPPIASMWNSSTMRVLVVTGGGAQTITPSGIASAEAFGTAKLNFTIVPSGIASAEAFGSATLIKQQFIVPSGIASAEAFGTALVAPAQTITGNGIASAEAFGTAVLTFSTPQTTSPGAIASAEAFGTPRIIKIITPSGIASAEAFGTAKLNKTIAVSGIASLEAFGTTVVAIGAPVATFTDILITDAGWYEMRLEESGYSEVQTDEGLLEVVVL